MEENFYIDHFGHPYDHESGDSWPAGGGLDKRCDYNAEALFCYYVLKTDIYFEGYDPDNDGGLYGYLHTEFVDTVVPES